MNIDQVLAEFRREQRTVAWSGELLEALPHVTRRSRADGQINWVSAYSLDADNVDQAIHDQIRHYKMLGKEFEWKVFS